MTDDPAGRVLRYTSPATGLLDSLPLGNGVLGALPDGGLPAETIAINHDTLWSGVPGYRDNPAAVAHLPAIRQSAMAADYRAADNLARQMQGPFTEAYQPVGTVHLTYRTAGARSYARELSLGQARHDVTSTGRDGAVLRRRSFVSAPAGALVHHVTGSRPGGITVTLSLSSPHDVGTSISVDTIVVTGRAPSHVEFEAPAGTERVSYEPGRGIGFALALAVRPVGGTLRREGGSLIVENADELVVVVTAGTTFRSWDQPPDIPLPDIQSATCCRARQVAGQPVEDLAAEHVRDHGELFNRTALRLGTLADGGQLLTTDERLRGAQNGAEDADLAALLFDYGRYLLIASSRPGSQPANLQGIWNMERTPPWNSNWTTNINTQMNYWPAEITGLPECHEPLIDLIEQLAVAGQHTARSYYGARGWTAHHNVDIWRSANPVRGGPQWANWAMGGAWLSQHLWQHYEFSGDRRLLRRIYPVLVGASLFILDMLSEDPAGDLAVSPATSPEHRFYAPDGQLAAVTGGTSMDYWIADELFTSTLAAAAKLGVSDPVLAEIRHARGRLRRPAVAADGTLLEWAAELPEEDPGHRHLSHLYGVYPGSQAHSRARDLRASAYKALRRRLDHGGGSTGWSLAWVIVQLARFGEADEAHEQLQRMTRRFIADNLFGLHPSLDGSPGSGIFQIDANFGVTAAITEMLLASHRDSIDVLPALPAAWSSGYVRGLRTRHRVDVDVRWDAGEVSELTLALRDGTACEVTVSLPAPRSCLVHADTGAPVACYPDAGNRVRMVVSLRRDRPSRFIRDDRVTGDLAAPALSPRSIIGLPVDQIWRQKAIRSCTPGGPGSQDGTSSCQVEPENILLTTLWFSVNVRLYRDLSGKPRG
jgi:alpha-L-fucosidase 2